MRIYVDLSDESITRIVRKTVMALGPIVEAAVAELKEKIASEGVQVKTKLDELKAKIDALTAQVGEGLSPEEVAAALKEIGADVEKIYEE